MKVQIRQSVFETNSSSEHSLSIVKLSNFRNWKEGKMYAKRSPGSSEFKETWGNFWSEQYYWSFAIMTPEEAKEANIEILEQQMKKEFEMLDTYERGIDTNIKKPFKKCGLWSTEEERELWAANSRKYILEERENLKNKRYNSLKLIDKLYDHMWITYEEYQLALRQDDCYSPFEHENETEDVAVFGKYFHS